VGDSTVRKYLILLALAVCEPMAASVMVGPGRPFQTVKAAIQSKLPLQDDLHIYVEMPTGNYSAFEAIIPDASWNGFLVKVTGLKWAPEITGYIDNVVYEWTGDEVLPSAYNIEGPGGVDGHITPSGDRRLYFKDHLGSTRMTVGNTGQILEASTFSAYGKEYWVVQPSGSLTREKFTGKEFDNEGGVGVEPGVNLFYFGARYYDPDIGMWISPDAAKQFHSPYSYSANPINGVDPDGNEFYVDKNGKLLAGPPLSYEDPSVFLGYDGPKIGEVGGAIDASTILSNLINSNVEIAKGIISPWEFKRLVQSRGPWDLKVNSSYIYSYDAIFLFNGMAMESQDVGNFHYGAVGQHTWFGDRTFLLQQAGAAQMRSRTSNPAWQVKNKAGALLPPYGDDPRDQHWIKQGFGHTYGR
jgi:RHS repeat-associated protein